MRLFKLGLNHWLGTCGTCGGIMTDQWDLYLGFWKITIWNKKKEKGKEKRNESL